MLTTDIINHSSSYRVIKDDNKKYVRAIVIGLSYNKDKLCKVFRNKFSEEEMKSINSSRYLKIDFKNNIIYPKQLHRIRELNDPLQKAMINKLCQIGSPEDIANDIKVQICVYDHDNREKVCTEKNYKYKINILKRNDKLYIISKKVNPQIELECREAKEEAEAKEKEKEEAKEYDIRAGNKELEEEAITINNLFRSSSFQKLIERFI